MIGFSLRTGLPASFLYARMRDVRMGMMADDGNLGGLRIKGEFTGAESETSPKVMAAMGWFRGLVLELEPMPNSDLHELDHIEIGVLFKECLMDLSAAGCDEKDLPSQTLWRNVWQHHFPKLRRRVHRAVDSKDKVRAELRRLLRTKKHNTTQGRAYSGGWLLHSPIFSTRNRRRSRIRTLPRPTLPPPPVPPRGARTVPDVASERPAEPSVTPARGPSAELPPRALETIL